MSKLKNLIQQLCPDGVEYKKLAECCALEKGTTPIQKAVPGEYPLVVTTEERKASNTYQFEKPTVCIPLISSRGHGVASLNSLFYQEGRFALGNILCGVTPINGDELSAKFLFYYLNHKKDTLIVPLMRGGANVSLTIDSLKNIKVPVPPISVQDEIVRIFDEFEALSIALTAELTARQLQYEYYNGILLSLKNVEYQTLEELCDIVDYRGKTPRKVDSGIFLVTAKNIRKGFIDYGKSQEYIAPEDYDDVMRRGKPKIGDVLFTTEAPCGNVAQVDNENIALAQRVIKYRPKTSNLNSTFLKYALLGKEFQEKLDKAATGETVKGIKGSKLHQLTIPVPPIEEQERIVAILDRFNELCNDLSSGLPAEIEVRRKQYEYYRDKLLTFKQLS